MSTPATQRFVALFLLLATLAVSQAPVSRAEDPAKIHPTGYVTDLAGALNANSTANLEALCGELEQKTGAQLAIVTVHSLEGQSVEEYAVDLYKKLGIGAKKDDRGVLLLVSPDQRKYRIEVGYGLEPVINDARAGDVGRAMVPYLRANDFNSAIQTAAWQLAKLIAADRGVTLSGQPLLNRVRTRGNPPSSIGVWLFLLVLVLIIMAGRGGGGGGWLWFLLGMLLNSSGGERGYRGGGFGGGGGGYSGGGGFGGFGGGSSSGGGASGSW